MSVCQRKQLPICLSSKVVSLLLIHVLKETARRGIREMELQSKESKARIMCARALWQFPNVMHGWISDCIVI